MNNVPSLPMDTSGTKNETEEKEARVAQQVLYSHAASLQGNGSFQFFRDNVLGKRVSELQAICCDRGKSSAERDMAVALLDEILKLRDWADETMRITREYIQS